MHRELGVCGVELRGVGPHVLDGDQAGGRPPQGERCPGNREYEPGGRGPAGRRPPALPAALGRSPETADERYHRDEPSGDHGIEAEAEEAEVS